MAKGSCQSPQEASPMAGRKPFCVGAIFLMCQINAWVLLLACLFNLDILPFTVMREALNA